MWGWEFGEGAQLRRSHIYSQHTTLGIGPFWGWGHRKVCVGDPFPPPPIHIWEAQSPPLQPPSSSPGMAEEEEEEEGWGGAKGGLHSKDCNIRSCFSTLVWLVSRISPARNISSTTV